MSKRETVEEMKRMIEVLTQRIDALTPEVDPHGNRCVALSDFRREYIASLRMRGIAYGK